MKVRLYINNEGYLDLFDDEQISLNDSVQNVNDLNKLYTAYTQSFTVPASDNNNKIFKHWYDSDIYGGFNAQEKVSGWIELNTQVYKRGFFSLERVNAKNNKPSSYSINFVGQSYDLKATLGDATLKDLAYDDFAVTYNSTLVTDTIEGTYYSLMAGLYFPLVSSKNWWEYGTASGTDITTNAGSIKWNELFPSVSFDYIFKAIVNQFNLPIDLASGDILSTDHFRLNHILFKNKELNASGVIDMPTDLVTLPMTGGSGVIDSVNNTIQFPDVNASNFTDYISTSPLNQYEFTSYSRTIGVYMNTSTSKVTVRCYKNGQVFQVQQVDGVGVAVFTITDSETYSFKVESENVQTINYSVQAVYRIEYKVKALLDTVWSDTFLQVVNDLGGGHSLVMNGNLNLPHLAPNLKLVDFIKGVLTQYNATLTEVDGMLTLQTLENWYLQGDYFDLTPFVDIASIDYQRVKLPNQIDFKKAPSKSNANTSYKELTGLSYGDLSATFPFDGEKLEFLLPWETPIPVSLATDRMVMFLLDKDSKPYIPNAMALTYNGYVSSPTIKINTGVGYYTLTDLANVGTTMDLVSYKYSINWGAEIDQQTAVVEENTLYKMYYERYISNLYNTQSRMVSLKAQFPSNIVNKLTLNDRFIINGKPYIINDYKLELTGGNCQLNLLNDFRNPIEEVVYYIDHSHQTVTHVQTLPSGWSLLTSPNWIGSQAMYPTYGPFTTTTQNNSITVNLLNTTREGYYFIYFYNNGIIQDKVVKVRIVQTGIEPEPFNAKITTDGTPKFTTDDEYKVTA